MRKSSARKKFEKQMAMLYSNYADFVTNKIQGVPMPYEDFHAKMEHELFRDLARRLNATQGDIEQAIYLCSRVNGREPEVESIILQCDRCRSDVYVDKSMAKMAFKAKQIQCNECFKSTSGHTLGELIAERLAEL